MVSESLWIVLGVVGAGGIFVYSTYNKMVKLSRRCDRAQADVDVQTSHRHDLIPQLVETVRGYIKHEAGVVDSLMNARNVAMGATSPQQKVQAEQIINSSIGQVMAMAENLPELHGSAHFQGLRRDIIDVQDKISAARRFLNLAVDEYNTSLDVLPGKLFAKKLGLHERNFFGLGVERAFVEEAPNFKF